jgi:hypothetical protein
VTISNHSDADVGEIWVMFDQLERLFGKSERLREVRALVGAGLFLERKLGAFKVGDRVALARTPEIGPDSGWRWYKEQLVEGAVGTVLQKELWGDPFDQSFSHTYGVSFDSIDKDPERPHLFCFRESSLRHLELR